MLLVVFKNRKKSIVFHGPKIVKTSMISCTQVQSASATSVGSGGRSPKAGGGAPKSGSTVRNR